ncbi:MULTISPECIES: hypothetical protein [Bradyrhizobium]|uniref:hypothetical protein n=1 Tax=Bradyrhizobium TaxID=374 RepID=UPI00117E68D9|nr:hypothetical protein [Bradyrhizobium japonicum]
MIEVELGAVMARPKQRRMVADHRAVGCRPGRVARYLRDDSKCVVPKFIHPANLGSPKDAAVDPATKIRQS